jgi:hypothetical protein
MGLLHLNRVVMLRRRSELELVTGSGASPSSI